MNPYILAIGTIFYISENCYFGWNQTPQSDAELLADGIVLLILALAILRPAK